MDRENRGQRTPNRKEDNDRLERTGQKMNMKETLVESKYELNDNGRDYQREEENRQDESENQRQQEERSKRMIELQQQVSKIDQKLQEIDLELIKQTDKYSDRAMDLAHEKVNLKKKKIDISYNHQVQLTNYIRASRRRGDEENQKIQKIRREAEEQRERIKREIEESYQREKEEIQRRRNQTADKKGEEQPQQSKLQQGEQTKQEDVDKQGQEALARSRRQLRIAEIQAQLAESRLRRSRISILNAELDYLRSTYTYPYWTWRDYYIWRDTYHPYSLYPYTYPYTSLYPPSYLYPYPSYSYLYPYRYRWWL